MSAAILVELKVKPEFTDEIKVLLKEILPDTRAFKGFRQIEIHENMDDPSDVVFYEVWDSRAHYEKYLAWRTETGFLDRLSPMLAAPPNIRFYSLVDV